EAINRTLKAEREKTPVKGKDAEVQAAWTKMRQEGSVLAKKIADARGKLAAASGIVELSVGNHRPPRDVKKSDDERGSTEVHVSASVKTPNGQSTTKNLIVTMQRAMLKGDREVAGRWIITNVRDASAPAGTKTS